MPKFWMITNRNRVGSSLGSERDSLAFYTGDEFMPEGKGQNLTPCWEETTKEKFRKKLQDVANGFPKVKETEHEKQKHVTVFIHGYNTSTKLAKTPQTA